MRVAARVTGASASPVDENADCLIRLVRVVGRLFGGGEDPRPVGGFGGGRLGHGLSQGPGVTASLGGESAEQRAAVILTPDQRVRVFISSTLEELAEERAAARRAIRRLHLVPVWYESGARPHPPQSMYRAYLDQSQIFVGIYWQRYGWVGPGMEISGLEDEYRLAAGMPMLLYLKGPGSGPRAGADGDDRRYPFGRRGVVPPLHECAGVGTAAGR